MPRRLNKSQRFEFYYPLWGILANKFSSPDIIIIADLEIYELTSNFFENG